MLAKKILFKITAIFLTFLFCSSTICLATDTIYVWSTETKSLNEITQTNSNSVNNGQTTNSKASTTQTAAQATTNISDLKLESGGAVLMEQHSGQVLYNHNMHEKLRPASVTKVMTILLIMESIDSSKLSYTDKIPCTENAAGMGGSQIWLDVREELTVDEMLKAICVVSANDCTVAMAEYLAGSQEAFVEKMNEKAKQLGMNDTTFKNCHGIDEDGHLTSPYDIALMSRELLNNHPSITKYTTIWMDSLRDGKSSLVNTNKLIRNYKGATGLKTGSTSIALYNLSASATRDNLSLIGVIMKAPSTKVRFAEAQKLLDYGFSNYTYTSFAKKGDVVKEVAVNKGVKSTVKAVFETDSGTLVKKGQEKDVNQSIQLEDIVQAPIIQGQKLGEATYSLNGEVISTVPIIAETAIDKDTFLNMTNDVLKQWFCLLRE